MDRLTPVSSPFPGVSNTKSYLPAFFFLFSSKREDDNHAPQRTKSPYTHLLETIYRLLIRFCLSVLIASTPTFTPLPFRMDPY